ncbi:hypothetical protein SFRURICE_012563 [Spodoptera frugiperda]|nr:hypothetical protein SFRURICE_012563 [Spodoptera frugiperda]
MCMRSIGAVEPRAPPPLPSPPPAPPQQEYIVCVPPELNFINFSVGHLHTQRIRLVNVSKFEVRLSLRPPGRQELDVQISGPRGLTVTSGAAAELLVHFRPADVRAVHDILLIRVSLGRHFLAGECRARAGCDVLELGARLLGDVHGVRLLLHCLADHASFFLLTEDSWLSYSLDVRVRREPVLYHCMRVGARRGGVGPVRGGAGVVARRRRVPGLHAAALRVLSSTATVRHLHVLADSLLFTPEHISIIAQEKDFDICAEGEPACQYYVQLGTAFPRRALAATVQLVNHSPVVYSYYWSVRPWSLCSCWEEERSVSPGSGDYSERLCPGAQEARAIEHETMSRVVLQCGVSQSAHVQCLATDTTVVLVYRVQEPEQYASRQDNARLVRVEPARGVLLPRSSCGVHVHVPDVGAHLGVQRAVLMLVLTDIPKEALPSNYDAMIVSVKEETTESIPGLESEVREVCELVCGQMEVWWEVAPVRFVLDPPVLALQHSRRVTSVAVNFHATQLFGCDGTEVSWQVPQGVRPPSPLTLAPAHTCSTQLQYPLPSLPNEYPETNIITLVAAAQEWMSQCTITRHCATRHPALRPARAWLGVVAPGTPMQTNFYLCNDTHQHAYQVVSLSFKEQSLSRTVVSAAAAVRRRITCISDINQPRPRHCDEQIYWWAEPFRWWGENEPSAACRGRRPCEHCRELACSCGLLRPARGALPHAARAAIRYSVNAPECDGCVATLVRARRTEGDVCAVPGGAGSAARAVLVAYRVLAPRLEGGEGGGDAGGARGTATLRPQRALTLGRRTCYRLRLTNITPLPTAVHFDADSGNCTNYITHRTLPPGSLISWVAHPCSVLGSSKM